MKNQLMWQFSVYKKVRIFIIFVCLHVSAFAQQKANPQSINQSTPPTHKYTSENSGIRDSLFVRHGGIIDTNTLKNQALISGRMMRLIFSRKGNESSGAKTQVVLGGPITLTITPTGTTCGYSNGTISVIATNGTAPYSFSINGSPSQSTGNFTGLVAGTPYNILVQDANGNTATGSVTLTNTFAAPSVSVSSYTSAATCSGAEGSVTLAASGGTAPYTYSVDGINFQNSNIFSNLLAGQYTFFVQDANQCIASVYFPLGASCFGFGFSYSTAVCIKNGYFIIYNVTGGVSPYVFSLDGVNFQTDSTFKNLDSGVYNVYVKDASGVVMKYRFEIFIYCQVSVTATETDATCSNNDGTITITAINGAEPYLYSLDGINFQYSNVFTGLPPGNYSVVVKGFNGGLGKLDGIVVNGICPLSLNVSATNETCSKKNGSITATPIGGYGPFTYSLDGINFQVSNIFTGLAASSYTVRVKDSKGTLSSATANISNLPAPSVTASTTAASCNNNDGQISALGSGGSGPLQFSIDSVNYQSASLFTGLPSASYSVMVKDTNGCVTSQIATIPFTNALVASAGNDTTICEGSNFAINASSNATQYAWAPAAGLNNASILKPIASPSKTTTYTLTATKGPCVITAPVTVSVLPAPIADPGPDSAICYGKSTQLSGSGGIKYAWSPPDYLSDPNISNPVAVNPASTITYLLKVTDASGCVSINNANVTITVTPTAKLFVGNDTSLAANESLQLFAADVNNSGFTQYIWTPATGLNDPNIQNPVAVTDHDITYTVKAISPGGCAGLASIRIKIFAGPAIYVPNAFTPNQDGHNDILKAIPIGIKEFKYFNVYNRWGQSVFKTKDPGKGWDGKLNGIPQEPGGFTWIAAGIDYQGKLIQRRGIALLIR
jgi:gliding motility-associated-like protein